MSEPFSHQWTISGLSSVCNQIRGHPHITKSLYTDANEMSAHFYPNGRDQSYSEYISLSVFNRLINTHGVHCRISILNLKNEKAFVREGKIFENEVKLNEYIRRDYLLDPANGLTSNNDKFTLCFEGYAYNKNAILPHTLKKTIQSTNFFPRVYYFDFNLLLSTRSLALKWTIENVNHFLESSNPLQYNIELPQIKDDQDGVLFRPQLRIDKKSDKNLSFHLNADYNGPIIIKTSLLDINEQKCCVQEHNYFSSIFNKSYSQYSISLEELYLKRSLLQLTDNRLTIFCEITRVNDSEIRTYESCLNFVGLLQFYESASSNLQDTEWTIDAREVLNKQNNIVATKEEMQKLEQLSNGITVQTSTIDKTITNVFNIYHEHYLEHANIKDSLVNTKSNSIFGNITLKSEQTDCTQMIEKLEAVVNGSIKPVLDQNEQMYSEMQTLKSHNAVLIDVVLDNQKLISEFRQEVANLEGKFSKMKQNKKMKKSKIKRIVDRIIALLVRIKSELNKVGTNISSTISQVRPSKPPVPKSPEPTLAKSNPITDHIELYTSPLIKYVQSVPTSRSISTETIQSHIHKLETVKTFLITHLPAENLIQNSHLDLDLITLENAEQKLVDIIDNHSSDWNKKLLTKLRDLIVESKSVYDAVLSYNGKDDF